jgi:hypothetical protein
LKNKPFLTDWFIIKFEKESIAGRDEPSRGVPVDSVLDQIYKKTPLR